MLTIKKRFAAALSFGAAVVGLALSNGCTQPGPRALFEGERLIRKGEYEKAVEKLRQATRLLPDNAQAWNHLGLAHHGARQAREAIQAYRRALERDRNLAAARYNLGCLFLEQGDPAATDELTIYVSLQPKALDGWLRLGAAQMRFRKYELAERSFAEALRLQAQNPEALNGIGMIQFHRGRSREATHYFLTALKRDPSFHPALYNLAVASQQSATGRATALQKYREYLALKPRPANWESVNAVARQLELELNPPRPVPTNLVAQTAVATNAGNHTNPSPARPTVRTNVTVTNPPFPQAPTTHPEVRTNAVHVAVAPPAPVPVEVVRLPEPPPPRPAQDVAPPPAHIAPPTNKLEAVATPRPAAPRPAASSPAIEVAKVDKPGLFSRLNPANWFKGKPATAGRISDTTPLTAKETAGPGTTASPTVGHVDPVTPLPTAAMISRYKYLSPSQPSPGNRRSAEVEFARGVQAYEERRWVDAVAAYRGATRSDPSFYEAQYNLGLASYEAGDLPTALAAYERALAIRPDSLNARFNFALALKRANHAVDAAGELEKVLATYPDETRAHLLLANLYAQQLFEPQLARKHYLKVLDLEPRHPQATSIRYWLAANP